MNFFKQSKGLSDALVKIKSLMQKFCFIEGYAFVRVYVANRRFKTLGN